MKKLLIGLLMTCGCAFPPKEKIDIHLRNKTGKTILLRAKAGPFGRTIKLEPGQEWNGYAPIKWIPKDGITIEFKSTKK